MKYKSEYGKELEGLLMRLGSKRRLLHEFLIDLLTVKEYKDLAIRWQIVKQLEKGVSQRDITKNLKVSIVTVTRGSRELSAKKGGFQHVLRSYYKKSR